MTSNIGIQIKIMSIVVFVLNLLGSLGGAIAGASIVGGGEGFGIFIGALIGGVFVSYLIYVFMYGFGELVENSQSINAKVNYHILNGEKLKKTMQNKVELSSQPKSQANPQVVSQLKPQVVQPESQTEEQAHEFCVVCKRSDVALSSIKIRKDGVIHDAKICPECLAKKMAQKK